MSLKWAMLLLLAGCTATPKFSEPLDPGEMMTCHRLGQFLICNPQVELAFLPYKSDANLRTLCSANHLGCLTPVSTPYSLDTTSR